MGGRFAPYSPNICPDECKLIRSFFTGNMKAFRFLLAHQFENKMGHHLVLGGRYSLEEACTTKDIDTSLPFTASVRRGMKINMSMIFEVLLEVLVEPRCPRCQATTSTAQEKALVQW